VENAENKGLKKLDKFTDMIYLESFTIPQIPAILNVGTKYHYNSMTIGFGSLGSLLNILAISFSFN